MNMAVPAFNSRDFNKTGYLAPDEYEAISSKIQSAVSGIRIPQIRKALTFTPYAFDKYMETAKLNFNRTNAPIQSTSMEPDFEAIPFFYTCDLSCGFFPDFVREYFGIDPADDLLSGRSYEGSFIQLSPSTRSILLAGHNIKNEVAKRWDLLRLPSEFSGTQVTELSFYVPAAENFGDNDKMKILLEIYVLV